MRFYEGAHEYLFKALKLRSYQQCVYLVPEVDNKYDSNAVMLHNGKQKLGSVSATEAPAIKRLLESYGKNNVLICSYATGWDMNFESFKRLGSISVWSTEIVNERLARKFAAQTRVI